MYRYRTKHSTYRSSVLSAASEIHWGLEMLPPMDKEGDYYIEGKGSYSACRKPHQLSETLPCYLSQQCQVDRV
jgi:hypothetical protein